MMQTQELLAQLNRRYATKQFDTTKKLSAEQLDALLETLRLSPSSFGLQGWGFVVVEDAAIRAQLLPYAWNQPQITDASHLIVLCRRTDVDTDFVTRFIESTAAARGIDAATLDGYKGMMLGFLEGKSEDDKNTWLAKQTYVAQGMLLSSCAMLGIDACPMEGFDPAKFNEILGLADHNLAACTIVPVGFRNKADGYAHAAKVRFAKEDVIFVK
jgi:nitroreductase / dihydropteridine reductase